MLLVDEAYEMSPAALCELRLLASARFDSQQILCVVIAGDARLIDKLRREDLLPLGSRIRTRLATEHASREELFEGLGHLLDSAGKARLMTAPLRHTLCDHAAGDCRILTTMAAELLAAATQRELPQLDEKPYLNAASSPPAVFVFMLLMALDNLSTTTHPTVHRRCPPSVMASLTITKLDHQPVESADHPQLSRSVDRLACWFSGAVLGPVQRSHRRRGAPTGRSGRARWPWPAPGAALRRARGSGEPSAQRE